MKYFRMHEILQIDIKSDMQNNSLLLTMTYYNITSIAYEVNNIVSE